MLRRRLDNGLDVVIQENNFSKMFAVQCWIGVGSLAEESGEEGISHCIEHMLFKGTRKFAVGEISKRVEFLGGEMNAYTSFENTVFYITLPAIHAAEALEILHEAIFHSSFDADELDREREVILEELKRSLDSPSHALGRKVFETIYKDTKAAIPIIGYESTIRNFTRESLLSFHRKWYQPENMQLVAVGNVDSKALLQVVEATFGTAKAVPIKRPGKFEVKRLEGVHVHFVEGDYEQPRLEIAFPAPSLLDDDVLAIDLAAFALGSGEASRLHRRLRDELQLTSVVGASVYAPQFGGLFELSAMPHADNFLECVEAIGREIARLKTWDPVNLEELERARANAKSDRIYSEETVSGQARAIGNALQTPHQLLYDLVVEAKVNRLTPHAVNDAFRRWFGESGCVIACVLPKEGPAVTAEEVKSAFQRGLISDADSASKENQVFQPEAAGVYKVALTPQITVLYRQQNHIDLMNVCAVRSGGLRCETADNLGVHHIVADLIGAASQKYDYEEMLRIIEGQGAVLSGFSGKDSFGIKLQCLTEQFPALLPVFGDAFLNPVFPEVQLQNSKLEVADDIQMEKDQPASIAMRAFQQALYADHPYRHPVWGSEATVQSFSCEQLLEFYHQTKNDSHWIISGVGRLPFADFYDQIKTVLGDSLEKVGTRAQVKTENLPQTLQGQHVKISKVREQSHLVVGTLGLSWSDPDRHVMDVLASVLGGSGGLLFLKLRDQQSLAYTVSPLHSHGCHKGLFGVYMACSPQKLQEATQGIELLWASLCNELLPELEIERAVNYLIGGHEADMQRGDSQAMTMALMELYGLGFDDFDRYADALRQVKPSDVQRLARKLLQEQGRIVVTVGPEADK